MWSTLNSKPRDSSKLRDDIVYLEGTSMLGSGVRVVSGMRVHLKLLYLFFLYKFDLQVWY